LSQTSLTYGFFLLLAPGCAALDDERRQLRLHGQRDGE